MKDYDSRPAFETMEQSPQGYEAHCILSPTMEVSQYHCHDYFEFYIHLRGGQFMGVDNHLYTLRPNQVFILPPFFMHGLGCTEEMRNYERAFLNISPEVLGASADADGMVWKFALENTRVEASCSGNMSVTCS